MTGVGPTDQRPPTLPEDAAPPAADRSSRQTFANMLRSLLPLLVIIVAVVGWTAFRQSPDVDPVKEIDPSSTIALAANRAGYPVVVPTGLPDGYRPTSARTDAGDAEEGDPVTLEIGYVTPSEEFAGFVVSDDPRADAVTAVLNDATQVGSVQIGGESWTRSTRPHDGDEETVLSRSADGVTVLVSGSASPEELEVIAGAVQPYSG
jgi:hypothetical protein